MKKNYEMTPEKSEQKNENFCPCSHINELDKLNNGNPLVNKKINKKNSCC